jgi:hypothetical protein
VTLPRHSIICSRWLALIPALFAGCSGPEPSFGDSNTLSSEDALRGASTPRAARGEVSDKAAQRDDASDAGLPSADPGDAARPSPALCGNAPCQCNNGQDDDGDGTIDGADVECTGALDDDERTFATGIPGDNKDPKWQDCFFDGNSGAGNDGCNQHTCCLLQAPDKATCHQLAPLANQNK